MTPLYVDLNALRGSRLVTYLSSQRNWVWPPLRAGDLVEVIEEEGDRYAARVVASDGNHLELELDFRTLIPAARLALTPTQEEDR